MTWTRGPTIGRGSSATVSLAFLDNRHVVASKSAPLSASSSLIHEESVLRKLRNHPRIISSLGHDITTDPSTGECLYNLFLEYLPRGSLHDVIHQSRNGSISGPTASRYAKSILEGLKFIHGRGYVHCDIKLKNLLVCEDGGIKIADFGLAKKTGEEDRPGWSVRGTPIYMSPEAVAGKVYEAPMDIWAVGCAVAEMVSGRPPWDEDDVWALMMRIGFGEEEVEIPREMVSENGRDFLRRCFVRDPARRWTAEMLLDHPFLDEAEEEEEEEEGFCLGKEVKSPTSVLSPVCFSYSEFGCGADRVGMVATGKEKPDWSLEEGWISVRELGEEFGGVGPAERIGLVATTRRMPEEWWHCFSDLSLGDGWICVRGCENRGE